MTTSPEDFTPPPGGGPTGDVMQAHTRIWRRVEGDVEDYARRITDDRITRGEVIQAAHLELWRRDPSRCDITKDTDVSHLMLLLKHAMSDEAARLRGRSKRGDVPPDLRRDLLKGGGEDSPEE